MAVRVEFHFDFGSPNAYLAHAVIPEIEARTGVPFEYVPILLGGVFKATGNRPPMDTEQAIASKWAYRMLETRRFVARHGLTRYTPNPHFPVNTLALMRGAVVARRDGYLDRYADAVFHHMWEAPKKMDDPDVAAAALAGSGLPVDEILAGSRDDAVKQALKESTEDAVRRGVFGAPSIFVGDALYFGKDRLREVEEEIVAQNTGG